jgi:Paraquat-inducible protein A
MSRLAPADMRLPPSFSSRSCSSSPSGASAYGAPLATPRGTLPSLGNRGFCAWVASSSPLAPVTGSGGRPHCPQCGSRLVPRRPGSLATTAALTPAGYILYLPANVLPVLTITRFGRTEPYTILGGVRDLAAAGLWPLALLVLFASILVPVLKLAGLSWFLIAIRFRSAWLLRERTALYRLIDFIGRVVEYRRVHDLDRVGAFAVRDPHHGRSGTGYREFRGSRRADHDRRARFRPAADVGCGEGTALSDFDPSGPAPRARPLPKYVNRQASLGCGSFLSSRRLLPDGSAIAR